VTIHVYTESDVPLIRCTTHVQPSVAAMLKGDRGGTFTPENLIKNIEFLRTMLTVCCCEHDLYKLSAVKRT
jgi:hypothetical protein